MAGRYHFSRDVVFNENAPGHLSPRRGHPTNHDLLPQPSILPDSSSPNQNSIHNTSNPHTAVNPLPAPNIADVIHARDLTTRITRSSTDSLPKTTHHRNDIDFVNLSISLNDIYTITPPTTPDLSAQHLSLLHDCFLSAPLPFLRNHSWDLSKPPNSYHEATTLGRSEEGKPQRERWNK
jgi:hypothetical protein